MASVSSKRIRDAVKGRIGTQVNDWIAESLRRQAAGLLVSPTPRQGLTKVKRSWRHAGRLRKARLKVRWTQERLAEACKSLSQSDLSRIESGRQEPQPPSDKMLLQFILAAEGFSGAADFDYS